MRGAQRNLRTAAGVVPNSEISTLRRDEVITECEQGEIFKTLKDKMKDY